MNKVSQNVLRAAGFYAPPPFGKRKLMISGRSHVFAGTAKKRLAFAAFSALLSLPAFGQEAETTEPSQTIIYDGGSNLGLYGRYQWGHNALEGNNTMHVGSQTVANDGTVSIVFREYNEDNVKVDGDVIIYKEVVPHSIVIESGSYTLSPLAWTDGVFGLLSLDGVITGSASLTVKEGASLTVYIDNDITGDVVVDGTLTTKIHEEPEDGEYESGHSVLGSGNLIVGSTGTLNLEGTHQDNKSVQIAGTVNLGVKHADHPVADAYNPFTSAENVTLVSGGTLNLGGNDDVVLGANNETALTVQGGTIANGTLDAVVDIALAEGTGLTLDGATLSQTVTDLELSAGNTISLENGASMSVNGLTVTVDSLDNAAITLNGNSSLTVGGTLQVNIDESLLKQLIEDSAGGTASLPIFSVADSDGDVDVSEILSGFDSIKFNDGSQWVGTLDPTTGGIIISAVPEPAFIGLFFGALVLLHSTRRRRHSSSAAKV